MNTQQELLTIPASELGVVFPDTNQTELAWIDYKESAQKWRIWLMLAYQDIKLRYRRSVLGPLWLTISMAITVYSMGFLYGHLFHIQLEVYYPFLIGGMLSWSLISTILMEMTDGLTLAEGFIKQIKLPYTLYIHRIATRNIIIFLHNLLVIIPIVIIYHDHIKITFHTLLIIPGLLVIYLNAITYGLLFGMVGARFRDISQVIKSLIQVVFFMTPVMWTPAVLGPDKAYIADLNPFYAFIELIRAPLLGATPSLNNLLMVTLVTTIGMWVSTKIFIRFRSRIVYWL